MQYRVDGKLPDQTAGLRQVNEKLTQSLDGILGVIRILQSGVWQGESKEAALSLLSILHTYHLKIAEASQQNLDAMIVLDEKASEYMNGGAIPVLWASEGPSKSFEEQVSAKISEAETYVYNKAQETYEYAETKVNEAENYVETEVNNAKEYVSEKASEVKKDISDTVDNIENKINNTASNLENYVSKFL